MTYNVFSGTLNRTHFTSPEWDSHASLNCVITFKIVLLYLFFTLFLLLYVALYCIILCCTAWVANKLHHNLVHVYCRYFLYSLISVKRKVFTTSNSLQPNMTLKTLYITYILFQVFHLKCLQDVNWSKQLKIVVAPPSNPDFVPPKQHSTYNWHLALMWVSVMYS